MISVDTSANDGVLPRPEYPRPQFRRRDWLCLNGEWEFEIDSGDSGVERGLLARPLRQTILVPFCPESERSGIGHTDFMNAVFYRRRVVVPADWSGAVLLHFQAVDYEATVWVNGVEVKRHRGGFTPFTCELQGVVGPGETAEIVVRARDLKDWPKPAGKQAFRHDNDTCFYTRTTGIWQTVWMEPVPPIHLRRPRITPDVAGRGFDVEVPVSRSQSDYGIEARLYWEGREVAAARRGLGSDFSGRLRLDLREEDVRLWEPGDPKLYDLRLELRDAAGAVVDWFESYCGLRGVAIDGRKVLINGRPVFQRQVLDQGYYPDGILTAPTDEALRRDIELTLSMGFNTSRLHEKVFEERFLYHADRLGLMVWGEFPNWGMWGQEKRGDASLHNPHAAFITQWLEVLERDYSHPCLIGWCALNEEAQPRVDTMDTLDDLQRGAFLAAKAMDSSRPVLDISGHVHRVPETDVYDVHDYTQDPETLRANHACVHEGKVHLTVNPADHVPYGGQPFFVSEFGGIVWPPAESAGEQGWGYGDIPQTGEEFLTRFERLCCALMDNPDHFGFCYTQFTDVFQEKNGVFFFDRSPKFPAEKIRAILTRPAAIEA